MPDAGIQGLRGSVRESDAHDPNAKPEGRQDEGTPHWQPNLKRKQVNEAPESESDSLRRTRGRRVDYCHLNNPFSDDKDEDINVVADISDEAFSVAANDGAASLKEAKKSDEWPEWEKAIKAKLTQLQDMGTWRLVKKPANAIPIANKWVFAKKRNKQGQLTKYKARLVAKGYTQRPSYNYVEMHSPVVCLETIHLILAIATIKGLVIQQMDVKGAYLNGMLNEQVYMHQPEGFEDGTDCICELLKSLYGLKQSGQAWNIEFDRAMQRRGFKCLRPDPCAYIRREHDEFAIITVWVDDLLLFAMSDSLMERMKKDICTEWETTDLGELSKIIRIEITRTPNAIFIRQRAYIESILKREGMECANPVAMPLDPNSPLQPNPDGNEGDRSNSYARLLGELQFIANATRPDIAYAVSRLASYTANPSLQHVGVLKRVLRYLQGTKEYGITYQS
jgi:hypothetical protein